jgi:hypothetical protein
MVRTKESRQSKANDCLLLVFPGLSYVSRQMLVNAFDDGKVTTQDNHSSIIDFLNFSRLASDPHRLRLVAVGCSGKHHLDGTLRCACPLVFGEYAEGMAEEIKGL